MNILEQTETVLGGSWTVKDGAVVADDTSKRIEYLTKNVLKQIAISDNGWDKLFIDERDSRFWELTYIHSEQQGGGQYC